MSKNAKNAKKIQQKRTNRNNRTPGNNKTQKKTTKKNTWFAKLKAGINVRRHKGVEEDNSSDEKS
jgi:hypothetical protein